MVWQTRNVILTIILHFCCAANQFPRAPRILEYSLVMEELAYCLWQARIKSVVCSLPDCGLLRRHAGNPRKSCKDAQDTTPIEQHKKGVCIELCAYLRSHFIRENVTSTVKRALRHLTHGRGLATQAEVTTRTWLKHRE